MVWEALGSAAIGLGLAYVALRLFPARFPARPLTLATGPVAALLGGLVTRAVLGAGHPPLVLAGALAVAGALLSLLVREAAPRRSASPRTA
ncbi:MULTISPECIES: hypothetical protein [Streptomycetaceae]|uniref:Integral membrane protein n=1 Tax=Streptantibioticus cattleyicolor (strain ATCC 35852 / DSM 46488 / JCM 4925 / NBRC 14057 / NRRL 8057) TaxID=1003195 RepID=F8K4M4_STREN|nr:MULTISPECIES: hypothetical protein [Streptomycetaceae]AEW96381.1 hypothetical protein SCATT_40100 [Streptantibioticus cattleyicolor NRRL 8057 = DSM 46488]MYS60893.1 hypothetical protein [Streptomyces sp. SID5468]CCB76719.1 conserved membrane protein of unknown function [Streptantibioticus cattleyicolor NRRL 8057 = DSM 46488]